MGARLAPLLALLLAACGDDPFRDASVQASPRTGNASAATGSFDPAMVDLARKALDDQPWTSFVQIVDMRDAMEWRIGVKGTGQRELGYARITCMILGGHSLVDAGTRVWVLDDARARAAGASEVVKQANLGGMNCATLQELSS